MAEETKNALISKLSFRNGLLLGGISTALTIVLYIINPVLQYTNLWVTLFIVVVMLALVIILSLDTRKKLGGFWTFGQAYLSLIILSVVVVFISILVGVIILKFVDPNLPTKINDALLDVTTQRLEKFNMDQSQIDAATKPFTDGSNLAKLQPTFVNQARNFLFAIIFYAIVDLIVAACVKKKPPMFPINLDDETDPNVVV